ncbi:ABC transporter related protein [Thermobaculum terrenum ATCC BAA-798]|uniref:ABC transporter related protein n=2 Tax=Thermobaculum TaxID=262406 RepID=D1CI96_THET1|nr:ABC transporter related protein [Thermobaculum terrenum ATCC BAA-798]
MTAIEVQGLTKLYGRTEALRGIDLAVPEGCLFGLLGPNGAGKTTLIKALVGALRPSGGSVRVLGLDPLRQRRQLRQQIGYMPQSPALYEDLSARGNIAFFGGAHMSHGLDKRVEEVLELTDLTGRADDPVHTLSGGMKNRVSLAAALVHSPRVLFLDEPTAGVDPHLRARFWELFRRLTSEGTTVLISTHLMDEAMLCDRLAILLQGKVIADAPPRQLVEHGRAHLRVREQGRTHEVLIGGTPEDLAEALRPYGLRPSVEAVSVSPASLEEVILSLWQEVAQ